MQVDETYAGICTGAIVKNTTGMMLDLRNVLINNRHMCQEFCCTRVLAQNRCIQYGALDNSVAGALLDSVSVASKGI
jgi:hypothetical protein